MYLGQIVGVVDRQLIYCLLFWPPFGEIFKVHGKSFVVFVSVSLWSFGEIVEVHGEPFAKLTQVLTKPAGWLDSQRILTRCYITIHIENFIADSC